MGLKQHLQRLIKPPSLATLRLRPYGDSLMTPAVEVWLGFAWVVILLMASIEGIVWGLVGVSIVPAATPWLRPIAGLFMFALMFSVIWIVDASLIMSERPVRSKQARAGAGIEEATGQGRWLLGLLTRVLIVAVSLYVTAPFLAKLIRADDIEGYHQRQVEQYHAARDAAFQAQLAVRAAETLARDRDSRRPLEDEIERLGQSLAAERERRARIEAEYAPEIQVLRNELAAAQQRLGDEIHGRQDRPPGYGPEARRWDARANQLVGELAAKQREIDRRIAEVERLIADLEQRLRTRTDDLQRLRQEQQERMERIRAEVAAAQPEENPPRLTFAARSKALQALRESPDEAGVPHFETVEGFAQAALAILFFALIALKLFEPAAARAYFNESLQFHYRKYLEGGLDEIPGFAAEDDPKRRLGPVELRQRWQRYIADPDAYFAEQKARLAALAAFEEEQAEHHLARLRLTGRRENLEEELQLASRRRETDLESYQEEQRLRTEALRTRLADETKALHDRASLELETEAQRAQESWALQKAREEAELRARIVALEHERAAASEQSRLREKELELLHQQRQEELRQADAERQHRHALEQAELMARRRREARDERLTGLRGEIARLSDLEQRQTELARKLRESGRQLLDQIATLRERIATSESSLAAARQHQAELKQLAEAQPDASSETARPRRGGFWLGGGRSDADKAAREARRELPAQEKRVREEQERLTRLRDECHALERRQSASDDQLHEVTERLLTIQTRRLLHEDAISTLLTQALDPPTSA